MSAQIKASTRATIASGGQTVNEYLRNARAGTEMGLLQAYVQANLKFPFEATMTLPRFFIGVDAAVCKHVTVTVEGIAGVEPQTGVYFRTSGSTVPAELVHLPPRGDGRAVVLAQLRQYMDECVLVNLSSLEALTTESEAFAGVTDPMVLKSWQQVVRDQARIFETYNTTPDFRAVHQMSELDSETRVRGHLMAHVGTRFSADAELVIMQNYISSVEFPFEAAFYEGSPMRGVVLGVVEPLDPRVGVVLRVRVGAVIHGTSVLKEVQIEAKNCFPVVRVPVEHPPAPAPSTHTGRGGHHAHSTPHHGGHHPANGEPHQVTDSPGKEPTLDTATVYKHYVRRRVFEDYRVWYADATLVHRDRVRALVRAWDASYRDAAYRLPTSLDKSGTAAPRPVQAPVGGAIGVVGAESTKPLSTPPTRERDDEESAAAAAGPPEIVVSEEVQ